MDSGANVVVGCSIGSVDREDAAAVVVIVAAVVAGVVDDVSWSSSVVSSIALGSDNLDDTAGSTVSE
jgi:hypothetical protein